jgi:translation initiation factor 1
VTPQNEVEANAVIAAVGGHQPFGHRTHRSVPGGARRCQTPSGTATIRSYDRPMSVRDKGRLVYSTGLGSICPGCGWPDKDCKCSSQRTPSDAIPKRIVAKLRMEKKGRGGKTVTLVDGLPNNAAFLKELCSELKRACGTGGAVADAGIELQGDLRDRVREVLEKKGYVVKG